MTKDKLKEAPMIWYQEMLSSIDEFIEAPIAWYEKMFFSTDYLLNIPTTWQYMLASIVVYIALVIAVQIIFLVFRYEFRVLKILMKVWANITYLIVFVGLIYYLMVLLKIMWSFA